MDKKSCDHCYCKKDFEMDQDWKKIPHKRCCNCGNMQKISDAEMNIKQFERDPREGIGGNGPYS